ncbi:uncharacterized protein LOC120135700 [Hibiscus syriacus]|uniref:uncharacterized protein LOC120135700 n=1 Tax=Hibiscus syriacus TaxID=106335 RepID=UPI001921C02F|nr:uncharacterized protein LOC120135700 [Hibiscus syriacus]
MASEGTCPSSSSVMLDSLNDRFENGGFVDGSVVAPDPSLVEQFNAWTRANNLVYSWILNSVSKDIAASLLYHSTAAEILKDLGDRFQQSNGPRLFQLKKNLSNLVQGQMNISTYYTQLKIIWDELSSTKQQEQVVQFLMGLNESYAEIKGQILLMDHLPLIAKVFSLLLQEANQRRVSKTVFVVKTIYGNCKNRPQCSHYNALGHTKDKCYKLHGYPPGYTSKN